MLPADHLWLRVCSPGWHDPLDSSFAARAGGRWNPPRSGQTLYLNRDLATARAQIVRLLAGSFVDADDLTDDAFELVAVHLPPGLVAVDAVSNAGLIALGLPSSYPLDESGQTVAMTDCQAIAVKGHLAGMEGVEARSAATANGSGRELAWWPRDRKPTSVGSRIMYGRWRSTAASSAADLFTYAQ